MKGRRVGAIDLFDLLKTSLDLQSHGETEAQHTISMATCKRSVNQVGGLVQHAPLHENIGHGE